MREISLWGDETEGYVSKAMTDCQGHTTFLISYEDNIENEVEEIFQYYRKNGFPNYNISEYNLEQELYSVKNLPDYQIINNKDLTQAMNGCGVLWAYFPHWIEIECNNSKSLKELWEDDEKLRALIRKTYRWQQKFGNGVFTINRLRQNAKVYLCSQSVSNFRPTVAKYIYNKYGNEGTVWDMSSGFGGRLLGFYASNCSMYIGTDPSTKTYEGLLKLNYDLNKINPHKKVMLLKQGSEIEAPISNACDLCFTSPPYFNTEKYSNEDTQSYKKYPSSEEWINGFLTSTVRNCYEALKDTGKLIINISNVVNAKNLESETVRVAQENGFELVDTLYLILSSIAGKGIKREPVFVFNKI